MRINHKQQELIDEFLLKAKIKFPELEIKNYWTNPDDYDHILINVTANLDEQREEEFRDFEAETEADIHLDYGYRISLMLQNLNPEYV
jgi:hypothetical protein